MAKSTKALLTGRIQKCKTNPSIAHTGLATHVAAFRSRSPNYNGALTQKAVESQCRKVLVWASSLTTMSEQAPAVSGPKGKRSKATRGVRHRSLLNESAR